MKIMIDLQTTLALYLLLIKISCHLCANGVYKWGITIVKYEINSAGNKILNDTNLACWKQEDCSKMYARIKVLHNGNAGRNLDVSSMMNPGIKLLVRTEEKELLHFIDPLIVESNTCHCLCNQSFKWLLLDAQDFKAKNACMPLSLACQKMYLAPIPFTENMISTKVVVEDAKIGPLIEQKSVTFYNQYNQDSPYSLLDLQPGNNLTSIPEVAYLNIVPENTKLWAMPVNDHVLISSNEFETLRVGVLTPEVAANFSVICHNWKDEVKSILNLPDRVLIASKYGLLEQIYPAKFTTPVLLLQRCVKSLKTVPQAVTTNYTVVAMEDATNTSYYGNVIRGQSLRLQNLESLLNQTICKTVTKADDCTVISMAITRSRPDRILHLLRTEDYLLVEVSVDTEKIEVIHNFSKNLIPKGMSSNEDSYVLSDLSYTQMFAEHLFIYGNVLLYSPNAGKEVRQILNLENDMIELFVSSKNGEYAFKTKTGQFFFGKIGSLDLRNLNLQKTNAKEISIFFDSSGILFQLTASPNNNNTSFEIKKTRVPLSQALRIQNLGISVPSSQRSCSHDVIEQCNTTTTKLTEDKHERLCPFAKIRLRTFGYQFFSRQSITMHCLDRLNSDFMTRLSEIDSHAYEVKKIKYDSNYLDNCLWESPSTDGHRFLRSISLGRSKCYYFEIDIFLENSEYSEFNTHSFTTVDLGISVSSSNPGNLTVLSHRFVNFTEDLVLYKIEICDSGVKREQQPPGIGQNVVTAEFKILGAGLDCISNSYQDTDDVQGYFSTEVALGCPGLQKVIFDAQDSKTASGDHFCNEEDPGIPCFHFDRVFNPVFRLYDEATLKNEEFPGNFTLTVVGGGRKLKDISQYTAEEQEKYNFRRGSHLIWAPVESHDDKPILNNQSRSLRWLCSNKSPCAGITPDFPDSPVYFFNIEFSNRDVDNSNCDFTFRFTIKVHGLPSGSINPSLIIVLVCLGLMVIGLLVCFFVRKRYSHILKKIQWKDLLRLRRGRIETADQDASNGLDTGMNAEEFAMKKIA